MNSIYHGGAKIEEVKVPLFLYEEISDSIYFATGYSGVEDNKHVTEYTLSSKAKILDLVDGNVEENKKYLNEVMKKLGFVFEDEYRVVQDSWNTVGREVYEYDIDLALYPQVREELLKSGFNVIRNYSVFENTEPVAYAVLDSSVLELKREYSVTSDDTHVYLTVLTENNVENKESILGNSYLGKTGYGNIKLDEVKVDTENKKKKLKM